MWIGFKKIGRKRKKNIDRKKMGREREKKEKESKKGKNNCINMIIERKSNAKNDKKEKLIYK